MTNLLNQNKQSTRELRFESLEKRELLTATFNPISIPSPIQSDQVLVSQENILDNNVNFTMNSVLNTLGDRTLTDYNLSTSQTYDSGHTYSIENNVTTGREVMEYLSNINKDVIKKLYDDKYAILTNFHQVDMGSKRFIVFQAGKVKGANVKQEVYIYNTETKSLVLAKNWTLNNENVVINDNYSLDTTQGSPIKCEIIDGNAIVTIKLINNDQAGQKQNCSVSTSYQISENDIRILSNSGKINTSTDAQTPSSNEHENTQESNNAFSISKNVSLAQNYPNVYRYFQANEYTNFSKNYEVTLNDRKILLIQAEKRAEKSTTKEIYAYDSKANELLNIYTWSDLMLLSKYSNMFDTSFNLNSTAPVSCEIVNNHIVIGIELTNTSGKLAQNNIYGVKAFKRFELTGEASNTNINNSKSDTFFVNKNVSVSNYSDITKFMQKNNYTSVLDSYEVALEDRKIVFFQTSKKVSEDNISVIFSYDTKTKELLPIQSWNSMKNTLNISSDDVLSYSFNMASGAPVTCRVVDNHAMIQVGIVGRSVKTKNGYGLTASNSYELFNTNTQPNTNTNEGNNEGNNTGTTDTPNNPDVEVPDNYILPTISNISITESYPVIKNHIQLNNYKSVSKVYELSLSDRKIIFVQASNDINGDTANEVFVYDTKTKDISNINSWAELMKQNQHIEIYDCSIDTSSKTPITCEIDGNYAVVTVRLNFDRDASGDSKFQALKRYELQQGEASANNSTIKYDKYFVNSIQSISDYPIITRYLNSKNYNNILSSYELALNDRKFVFIETSKQTGTKTSSDIFVYDTKTQELFDIESWSSTSNKNKLKDNYSISSLTFDTLHGTPVTCSIVDSYADITVYYKGTSESAGRDYSAMAKRSFIVKEESSSSSQQNTNTGTSPTDTYTRPYGPMPREYYMNN